ncbi:MAG: hypothetical protein ABEJ62_01910 [Candidatus Nanohaloarchaea archaeon]
MMPSTSGRKGFVYTLEAIIASTFFLATVTTVVPGSEPANTRAVQETTRSALSSLDKTGALRDDMSPSALRAELEPFVPPGYNHSVRVTEVDSSRKTFSSPQQFYFDRAGSYHELQIWMENADNLNITFDGEEVVEDQDTAGYNSAGLSGGEGFLNFTGTGSGEFEFDSYTRKGGVPSGGNIKTVSYIVAGENLTEIKVFLWSG